METLSAQLQLDISSFSSSLARAGQEISAFASRVSQQMQAATASLSTQTQAAQQNTQATQQSTSANNALLVAMQNLQNTSRQQLATQQQMATQLGQVVTATQQTTAAVNQMATALQHMSQQSSGAASQFQQAWSTALGVLSALGIQATLRAITAAIKEFVTASISGFAEFERGLLKIATLTTTMTKTSAGFAEMGKQIHELSIATGIATKNIADAMFDVQSTLGPGKTKEAFDILKVGADLAVAGFTDVKTATAALSAVINQFGLSAADATRVANALSVASLQNRVDFEHFAQTLPLVLPSLTLFKVSLQSAGAVLATLTGGGLEAGKSVTVLNEILLAVGAPTARAKTWLDEFAKQTGQTRIELKRLADGSVDFLATIQQFQNADPELLRRLFGSNREALRGLAILLAHLQDLQKQLDFAGTSTTKLAQDSALAHSGLQQQWKQSMQAVNAFYDAVGAVIGQSPATLGLVRTIEQVFVSMVAAIDANRRELLTFIDVLVRFGQIGIAAMEGITQASIYLAGAVGAAITKIMDGVNAVISAYNWVKNNIPLVGTGTGGGMRFEGGEGMAASMQSAADVPATAPGGPVIPKQPVPSGLGVADIKAGLDATKAAAADAKRAAREAAAEAKRLADERVRITEEMEAAIAGVEEGAFAKKKYKLAKEIEDAKAASVDITLIAQYERDQLIKFTMEVTDKQTVEFAKRVAGATAAMQAENADIDRQRKSLNELRRLTEREDPIERERVAGMQRVEEARLVLQRGSIATSEQLEQEYENARTGINQRAIEQRYEKEQAAAQKALQPWKELATKIESTLSSAFENILSDTFDLWDSIKKGFIKLIADLAAAALTQQIIIPVLMGAVGSGGLASAFAGGGGMGGGGFAEGTTGADVAGGAEASGGGFGAGSAVSMIGSGASIYGGLTGQSVLGATGLLGGVLATPIGSIGAAYPGEATGISSAMDAMGLEATTIGEAAGAAGVGIAAGSIFAKLNAMMGLHGTANATLAGAGGGAIAGTMILPGIGTAIGAAIGALGGFIAGILGRGPDPHPAFQPTATQAGTVTFDPTIGLQTAQEFKITEEKHKDVGQLADWTKTFDAINASLQDMAGQVVSQFQSVAPELQQALVIPINQAFADIASKVSQLHIAGDDMEEFAKNMQEMMGTTLPGFFTDAMHGALAKLETGMKKLNPVLTSFTNILDTIHKDIQDTDTAIAQKVADVTSAFSQRMTDVFNAVEQSMESLRQQQVQLNATFKAASIALMTELYSPAQAFMFAQQQYADLKQQFTGSTQEQQLAIAPQLAQAAQQLLSMAKSGDVLGQDPETVRRLQASLIQDLAGFQGSTEMAFSDIHNALVDFRQTNLDALSVSRESTLNALEAFRVSQDAALQQQADLASGQITALTGSLANPDSIDSVITSSLGVLQLIQQALPGIMGTSTAEIMAQSQVVLLGGLTTIATSQLQVLQDISTKLGAGVPHFAEGSGTLPRPTFAMLHAGERVLSARENFGGGTTTIEHIIRAEGDTPGGQAVVNQVADAVIARIVHGASRLGTIPLVVRR